MAYLSDPFAEHVRKRRDDMDCRIQASHQSLVVALAKFSEGLNVRSKYIQVSLGAVAVVELHGKGMGVQKFSCDYLVLVLGIFEDCSKVVGPSRLRRAYCLVACRHEKRLAKGEMGEAQTVGEVVLDRLGQSINAASWVRVVHHDLWLDIYFRLTRTWPSQSVAAISQKRRCQCRHSPRLGTWKASREATHFQSSPTTQQI